MIASFVIIEYYSLNEILKCITAIQNLNLDFEYEIIVSSNSQYSKQKQKQLLNRYKNTKWSFNKNNDGFAHGMNRGISIAIGKYVILQNPDTKIIKGDLKQVFSFIEKESIMALISFNFIFFVFSKSLDFTRMLVSLSKAFLNPLLISKFLSKLLNSISSNFLEVTNFDTISLKL